MARTTTPINTGSGANVAVDQVTGLGLVQLVKLVNGTEGSSDAIPGDASGLQVQLTDLPEIDPRADYASFGGSAREVKTTAISWSAVSGNQTVIAAPGAGKVLRILSVYLLTDTGAVLTFKSASTTLIGNIPLQQFVPLDMKPYRGVVASCGSNEAFVINLSAAVSGGGFVTYLET